MKPNKDRQPSGPPPPPEPDAPLDPAAVARRLRAAATDIGGHLDEHGRRVHLFDDPIRTKNLEKVVGHLRQFAARLSAAAQGERPEGLANLCAPSNLASLAELAASVAPASNLSGANAWELADELDLLALQTLGWPRLGQVLRHRALHGALAETDRRYLCLLFIRLRQAPDDVAANDEARAYLAQVQREAMAEYRRSRAKIALRKRYLLLMSVSMAVCLLIFAGLFVVGSGATNEHWFALAWLAAAGLRVPIFTPEAYAQLIIVAAVVVAGALGAVLSRAVQLKNADPLQSSDGSASNSPLGLRGLSSTGTVFVAQAAIGAVSALVVCLVFQAGLLTVEKAGTLGLAFYSLVGFLAGYAEAWFIGTVGRVQDLI
jgi:hypothetical protein